MIETTRGLVVEQPIEVVTAYLADFANAQDWHPAIHDCTRLDIGHLQVGAQWRGRLSLLYWNGELDYTLTTTLDNSQRRRPPPHHQRGLCAHRSPGQNSVLVSPTGGGSLPTGDGIPN